MKSIPETLCFCYPLFIISKWHESWMAIWELDAHLPEEKWVVATGYENLVWSPGCPREEGNKMNAMDAQQQHTQPLWHPYRVSTDGLDKGWSPSAWARLKGRRGREGNYWCYTSVLKWSSALSFISVAPDTNLNSINGIIAETGVIQWE